jgi:hypothetical protein
MTKGAVRFDARFRDGGGNLSSADDRLSFSPDPTRTFCCHASDTTLSSQILLAGAIS